LNATGWLGAIIYVKQCNTALAVRSVGPIKIRKIEKYEKYSKLITNNAKSDTHVEIEE
jgi:hypothetical protein